MFFNTFFAFTTFFLATTFASSIPTPEEHAIDANGEDFRAKLKTLKGYVTGSDKELFEKALVHARDPHFYRMLLKLKSPSALSCFKGIFDEPKAYIKMKDGKTIGENIVAEFKTVKEVKDDDVKEFIAIGPAALMLVKHFCEDKKDEVEECKLDALASDMMNALSKALKRSSEELTEDEKKAKEKFLEDCDTDYTVLIIVLVSVFALILIGVLVFVFVFKCKLPFLKASPKQEPEPTKP